MKKLIKVSRYFYTKIEWTVKCVRFFGHPLILTSFTEQKAYSYTIIKKKYEIQNRKNFQRTLSDLILNQITTLCETTERERGNVMILIRTLSFHYQIFTIYLLWILTLLINSGISNTWSITIQLTMVETYFKQFIIYSYNKS